MRFLRNLRHLRYSGSKVQGIVIERRFTIILSVMICLLLAACSNSPAPTPTPEATPVEAGQAVYHTMTIDEFAPIIEAPTHNYTIVNVHIPYEGEIENTDLFVSYNDL